MCALSCFARSQRYGEKLVQIWRQKLILEEFDDAFLVAKGELRPTGQPGIKMLLGRVSRNLRRISRIGSPERDRGAIISSGQLFVQFFACIERRVVHAIEG